MLCLNSELKCFDQKYTLNKYSESAKMFTNFIISNGIVVDKNLNFVDEHGK